MQDYRCTLQGEEDMSHEYGLYDDYSEGTGNVYGSEGESDPHNEVTVKREVDGGVKGGGQRSTSAMKSSYQELSMPIKKEGMGEWYLSMYTEGPPFLFPRRHQVGANTYIEPLISPEAQQQRATHSFSCDNFILTSHAIG